MSDQPAARNHVTLADGADPNRTYLYVADERVSVAAFLKMDAPAATTVYAIGCTALTALDLPAATWVDARGCTALTNAIFAGEDRRGYAFVGLLSREGEWRIRAGCRNFDLATARRHWADNAECLALVERIGAEIAERSALAAEQAA